MPLPSARVLVPVALVMVAWAGVHIIGSHGFAATPVTWPAPAVTPSSAPAGVSAPAATAVVPSPAPGTGAVPVLPGALRQLNGSTRDTANGLYALIQQLEAAFRLRLGELIQQLEPGR